LIGNEGIQAHEVLLSFFLVSIECRRLFPDSCGNSLAGIVL
jgi:hypothetical protein